MRSWGLVCACLALGASLIEAEPSASTSALASIKIHRRHHQSRQESHTKHRYEIKGVKSEVDAILAAARGRIDVRSVQVLQSDEEGSPSDFVVLARVYAEDGDILTLAPHSGTTVSNGHARRGKRHSSSHSRVTVTKGEYDEESLIAQDRAEVAACLDETEGYLDELRDGEVSLYTDSAFFDCFRPYDQVFAYFDLLTEQNPDIMTKFPNASVTFEGRPIPAYRLSSPSATTSPKKALYTQSLIHAREWQSGSSSFYTVSSLIDDLRADNEEANQILDEFDWYFVPIVNIDGYKYAWEVDRMWRTNRDLMSEDGHFVPGVDLNRNFGPDEFFNLNPDDVDAETHPGDYPLSEPSTAGLFEFITGIDGMSGIVDMHTFGGQVLRPFSNQKDPPPEPYGSKMVALSDSVRDALSTREGVQYVSEPGGYLYEAFGCFDDGMFLAYNYTVPALTIEVEGLDFMVSQSTIRPVGENIDKGLRRFAREVSAYSSFVADYLS